MGTVRQVIDTKKPFLKMDYHFFPHVQIDTCLDVPTEDEAESFMDLDWEFDVQVGQQEGKEESYSIKMELATRNQGKRAYDVKLNAIGFFRFTDECPKDQWDHLIYILGQNMLYGVCREYLFTVTAHGPHPALYLPSVTFVPAGQDKEGSVQLEE